MSTTSLAESPNTVNRPEESARTEPANTFIRWSGGALLSGFGLSLAFEPVGAWWLAWLALVPLLILVRGPRKSTTAILAAWVGGLAFWLPSVHWVSSSHESAWIAWLALAVVLSFWWPIAIGFIRLLVRGVGLPLIVAGPAVWVGVEYLRGLYPLNGFPWFGLSQSQYENLPLIQIADLTGAWGVSLLIVLTNSAIADYVVKADLSGLGRMKRLAGVSLTLLLILVSLIYGAYRISSSEFDDGPRLALIQSDIPQDFENPPATRDVLETFRRLVDQATESKDRPDLIVWPETMFPFGWVSVAPDLTTADFRRIADDYSPHLKVEFWESRAEEIPAYLRDWTDAIQIPMLVGINSYFFEPTGLRRHNSAILVEPGVEAVQSMHKRHLVPFGEYVPLVKTFPWVLAVTPFEPDRMPSLDPALGVETIQLGPWTFGAVICFEDSVPLIAREALRGPSDGEKPAEILLNLSNDGWFRGTAAHKLHLANSVLRAVELRVPVARAVNTGVSAIIDGNGRLLETIPGASEGVINTTIPVDQRPSLYRVAGDWLPIALLVGSLLSLPLSLFLRFGNRKRALKLS